MHCSLLILSEADVDRYSTTLCSWKVYLSSFFQKPKVSSSWSVCKLATIMVGRISMDPEKPMERFNLYVMLCTIWYYLYNSKNVKNTQGGVLVSVKLHSIACNFTKSNTTPWLFLRFLNSTNGTKSRKTHHIWQNLFRGNSKDNTMSMGVVSLLIFISTNIILRGYPLSTYAKFSEEKNFAYVLNGWPFVVSLIRCFDLLFVFLSKGRIDILMNEKHEVTLIDLGSTIVFLQLRSIPCWFAIVKGPHSKISPNLEFYGHQYSRGVFRTLSNI